MNWRELREYGEQQCSIPFTARIDIDGPFDWSTSSDNEFALDLIDSEIAAFSCRLGEGLADARAAFSKKLRFSTIDERPLPWLAWHSPGELPVTTLFRNRLLHPAFALDRPLAGQVLRSDLTLADISIHASEQLKAYPITLVVTSITIDAGSIWARVTGFLKFGLAALPLVTLLSTVGPFKNAFDDAAFNHRYEERIENTVGGQTCRLYSEWHVDLKSLRGLSVDSLNYHAEGLSEYARALRVCNVQLALALIQGSPGKIDGVAGRHTQDALAAYAAANGRPADISDEVLRGKLLTDLQHFRRD